MATFKQIYQKQERAIHVLGRSKINYDKLGQTKRTSETIQTRIQQLEKSIEEIRDLDVQLHAAATEEIRESHPYFTQKQFDTCYDTFLETMDVYQLALVSLSPNIPPASAKSNVAFSTCNPTATLPHIEIPKFDGSFSDWQPFKARFTSLIISNQLLSNFERMHYLCSSLTGKPSQKLSHLIVSNENFDIAWNMLIDQFENERRIITTHVRELFSIQPVKENSAESLRTLRDTVSIALQSLANLNRETEKWDDLLVYLITSNLDAATRKTWERKLSGRTTYPTYRELDDFLKAEIITMEAMSYDKEDSGKSSRLTKSSRNNISSHTTTAFKLSCPACEKEHPLYQCTKFLSFSIQQRRKFIADRKRCFNCFGSNHQSSECKNSFRCRECKRKHHTLLHTAIESPLKRDETPPPNTAASNPSIATCHTAFKTIPTHSVLLATAYVKVYSPHGRYVCVRALLDQGSEATFISENLAQQLHLLRTKVHLRITGVDDYQSLAKYTANIAIGPISNDKATHSTTAIILRTLTKYSKNRRSISLDWPHVKNLKLADDDPTSSEPCELIIGSDLYGSLLCAGLRKGRPSEPVAQQTIFGWILSGRIQSPQLSSTLQVHHSTLAQLNDNLCRFWEIESIATPVPMSSEEKLCEDHFVATYSRHPDGRFIVRLPFKNGPPENLGLSHSIALHSIKRLENRFQREPKLLTAYSEFMTEYENLGHMAKLTSDSESKIQQPYYIPHHAVLRDSLTTHLRVVFNASSKTSNGHSLNDCLLSGPKLQTDINAIILRWRQFRYVLTADIAKMYRQILVHPDDVDYQRILWRPTVSDPILTYRLLTVTYGTAAAPFLALRVLKQLAIDEGTSFPLARSIIDDQIYVDDCLFGADDLESAIQIREELISLLRRGGFRLRKWASNNPALLTNLDESDWGLAVDKDLMSQEPLKILGIVWQPRQDIFKYKVTISINPSNTKRTVLSTIATLFDPLGLVSPVIIKAKIFLQNLWTLQCGWDDVLPANLLDDWTQFYSQLSALENVSINRWTNCYSSDHCSELHGFADASAQAYAAVIYIRNRSPSNKVTVSLLTAKSKVAPLKTISIPRLELCAALLLAQLMDYTRTALKFPSIHCHCWSD